MSVQEEEQPKLSKRRAVLRNGLALSCLAATVSLPFWSQIRLKKGEKVIPFTDLPENYSAPPVSPGGVHYLDTSKVTSFYTPNSDFFITQHYNQPNITEAAYQLNITGMVDKPLTLGMADIKARPKIEIDAGFECGSNSRKYFQGLIGNARWGGCRLKDVLEDAEIQSRGNEIVFYGYDTGEETVRDAKVEQNFGRSMHVDDAMQDQIVLAYEMNNEPLPTYHGAPLRLIVPGWYGVANVKWLSQIHVQDYRYMGRFMARDYVTLSKRMIGGEERWEESSVSRMLIKSSIIRVTQQGNTCNILGFALTDGTPLERVEVSINGGAWQKAQLSADNTQYSWQLFNLLWENAPEGEHTIVSRAIDINGNVQPTVEQMPEKTTRWENNAQFPRTILIS